MLVNLTTIPPGMAGSLKVTVPVDEAPPTMVVGATAMDTKVGNVIVRVADLIVDATLAVIVTVF